MIRQAVILAAGYGKRLRPLTDHTPKPLIPVHGEPLMAHTLAHLKRVGVQQVVVNTHHLADQIVDFLRDDLAAHALAVTISHEPTILETGGGILNALPLLNDAAFFSVNGDVWWQGAALEALSTVWDPAVMDALLLMVPRAQAVGYQGVGDYTRNAATSHSNNAAFLIQHRGHQPTAPYIYGGIQILHPRLFDVVKQNPAFKNTPFSLRVLYDHVEKKQRLYGMVWDAPWCDIGTLEALDELNTNSYHYL